MLVIGSRRRDRRSSGVGGDTRARPNARRSGSPARSSTRRRSRNGARNARRLRGRRRLPVLAPRRRRPLERARRRRRARAARAARPASRSTRRYAGAPVPPDAILPFRASGRNEPCAGDRLPRMVRRHRRRSAESRAASRRSRIHAGRDPRRAGDPRGRAGGRHARGRPGGGRRDAPEAAHARAVGRAEPTRRRAARHAWPALGARDGEAVQAGTRFVWRETFGTPNPAFRKIEITVADPRCPITRSRDSSGYLGQPPQR